MLERESERVAQAVEHVTFNHGVAGSSPAGLTNLRATIGLRRNQASRTSMLPSVNLLQTS